MRAVLVTDTGITCGISSAHFCIKANLHSVHVLKPVTSFLPNPLTPSSNHQIMLTLQYLLALAAFFAIVGSTLAVALPKPDDPSKPWPLDGFITVCPRKKGPACQNIPWTNKKCYKSPPLLLFNRVQI